MTGLQAIAQLIEGAAHLQARFLDVGTDLGRFGVREVLDTLSVLIRLRRSLVTLLGHVICSLTYSTFSRIVSTVCFGAISVVWICFTPVDVTIAPTAIATPPTM